MNRTVDSSAVGSRSPQNPSMAIEVLVRELVACLAEAPLTGEGMSTIEASSGKVLLSIQLDGVEYRFLRSERSEPSPVSLRRPMLSPREQEIVRLVAKGLPNKAIADVLDMSLWTVGTHMRRVFAKLEVGTRAAMIARVIEGGMLPEDGHILAGDDDHILD